MKPIPPISRTEQDGARPPEPREAEVGRPVCGTGDGPKYWRSLEDLADQPEFRRWLEREFPDGASEFKDEVSRRHFVKIMSASFLLSGLGLTGCRRPEEHITPFSNMPEGYVHGIAQFFATSRPTRNTAVPLLVKSVDGRPVKIEGNPNHPSSSGGTDALTQASILNLYDPDRAMRFAKNGETTTRQEALDALSDISKQYRANGGEGLAFLAEQSSSPSRLRLQHLIAEKFPKSRWHVFEPIDLDIARHAFSVAYERPLKPLFHLDKAKCILSLDCDFIGSEQDNINLIRGYAKNRAIAKPSDELNRLYVLEGLFTLTGANADHRLRLAPSQVLAAAARLLVEVAGDKAGADIEELAKSFAGDEKWLVECAKDLVENRGQSLVLAGYRQPLVVHQIACAINEHLDNIGQTISLYPIVEPKQGSIQDLVKALDSGGVETLIELGGNPVYAAPADLEYASVRAKARTVVRLGFDENESFIGTTWHIPGTHYLEAWGDARTADGTYVSIQPLIQPLFGGLSELEVLARIAGLETARGYDIVRETFRTTINAANFEESWKKFLHDGFWQGSAPEQVEVRPAAAPLKTGSESPAPPPTSQQLEVVFHRDYKLDDGRYNNNGWLQELPDAVTKLCWDNVILLSPSTAKVLGLNLHNTETMDFYVPILRVQVNEREIEGPAWIQPGMADNVLGIAVGYGRKKIGRIGMGVGFDAYTIRTSSALYIAPGAKVSNTGRKHLLATTQDHWAMQGRPIIREANMQQFRNNPQFAKAMNVEEPPDFPNSRDARGRPRSLYPNPLDQREKNALHQWGMSIDLNKCVGCTACVIACQSENNVPIVGKEQVNRNREMHWLRIDRYYTGDISAPQMVYQPMLCQHCEAAPCENVCPVNATSHDEEGLNVMTYNRCVGTRYCSNNCPYKVRRFNFFDYNKRTFAQLHGPFYPNPVTGKVGDEWGVKAWLKDPSKGYRPEDEWNLLKISKNPDVTVRMRGVMEKCTFCLQRIEQAKISQKVKAGASGNIRLKESEGTVPQTACQEACPADAIIFGDISDPESRVSKLKALERDYTVLEFLLTKPRLTYLAKVRNPNPQMPDYHEIPPSLKEYERDSRRNVFEPVPDSGHEQPSRASESGRKGAL